MTIGRVQTPTLAIVVARDREIETFKTVPFHGVQIEVEHPNGTFLARWEAKEEQGGLDSEGRLVDTAVADALVAKLQGKPGHITEFRNEPKTRATRRRTRFPASRSWRQTGSAIPQPRSSRRARRSTKRTS